MGWMMPNDDLFIVLLVMYLHFAPGWMPGAVAPSEPPLHATVDTYLTFISDIGFIVPSKTVEK